MTMNAIQDDIPTLSLLFSDKSIVINAEPIAYACPHESSSSKYSDTKLPTLSLFASKPTTLSLFPDFSENLATASKHYYFVNNPLPPSTDLCLSLLGTIPETSNSNSPNIISQDSCAPKRSFHESNIATPVSKRKGQDQKRRLIAAEEEEHWIIKKLTKSDVNGSSRLLLPRQEVKTYVIPFLDEQKATDCQKLSGTDVYVWDLDTQSEYSLTLKKWATHSFQLIRNWTPNFVKRRNLKQDDVIALRWDRNNSRFCFRVPSRHDQLDNES
uniref:TF-B3 domain-containing protein n=1 Tax=Nicotiana tabacum TaxID=4097 RepID=A0A1S3ZZS6_TOBAC|nr:PREDICTED: uncharacterized protein LOC107792137 [Nicotiana tabacum]